MTSKPASPKPSALRTLLAYAGRRQYGWYLAIGAMLLSTFSGSLALREIRSLLDPGQTPAETRRTLFTMVALTLLGVILMRQVSDLIARLAQSMLVDIRADYHASLMRQGAAFFRQNEVGRLLSIGLNDTEVIGTFWTQAIPFLLVNVGQLVLALIFMIELSWPLALGAVLLVGALEWTSLRLIVPRIQEYETGYRKHLASINAWLNENLSGVRDIQIFTQQARTTRAFRDQLDRLARYMTDNMSLSVTNFAMFYALTGLGLALVYGGGALGLFQGVLDVGLLATFAAFLVQFISPITTVSGALLRYEGMIIAAGRVFDVIAIPPEIREKPDAIDPGPLKGHIRFENVTFSYEPGNLQAWRVRDVNLELLPGEKVAFVGGSGSGKSTLVNLVARFYDVTAGRVTIDGYDVRDLKLDALRKNFGLVAQNVVLFQGTVTDNIRFARPDADMSAVRAAAEVSYVTEFVEKLDNGYETRLGEFGQGLSWGQKHRVSIARAALPDPHILILDEATSALDPQSEAVVMKALDQLSKGRTTLVISHRLNTIVNADKIVVLGTDENRHGVVRAVGQHDQLLETSPEYVELWGKFRRKAILMPIGPLYDTTAALPTVMGLARAYNAPTHILDFGPLDTTAEVDKRFGVTVVRGAQRDPRVINLQHMKRVHDIVQALRAEGIEADTVSPARRDITWVEATIQAIEQTQATHLVAVDNVMVPLDELRESIRQIERKAAVEYILVNPVVEMG